MRTIIVVVAAVLSFGQATSTALQPAGAIPLSNVEGRIDHLGVDLDGKRLFVAALGNNTMEVIDLAAARVVKSVGGLHEPQGIRYLPESHRIVVANGDDGSTVFFDAANYAVVKTVKLSGDADNVRYDAKAARVYVGYAGGALAVLDVDGKTLGDIRLPGHPEAFQLESTGPRIFVNVPSARNVVVVDRDKRATIAAWPVTEAGANYPMALDERHHRLFLGCRSPARLLVYDGDSGKLITSSPIVGDTDDLFYDAAKQRIYVIGGEGFITVLEQQNADLYRAIQKVPTAPGARTGLLVPELGRLFVAVPHRGSQRAEVRMYSIG